MRTTFNIFLLGAIYLTCAFSSNAQIVVGSGTHIATSKSLQIAFDNNLIVSSDQADFSNATLSLSGADQNLNNQNASTPLVLGGLIVGQNGALNNGTIGISGPWEITGSLVFNDGVIVPGSDGKITQTIKNGVPGDIIINNQESFVNGAFFSKGVGIRFFPIGNSNGYFPSQLFNVTQADLEVGMRVVESNSSLSHENDILGIFKSRYWELIDPSNSLIGPLLAVSTFQTSDFITPGVGTVVVGSTGKAGQATSLGGGINGDYVVGASGISASDRIFTIANVNSEQVVVKIHNVITPFQDNANDYLQIENIDVFPENKVMLLDRWGVKVKEWKNYANVLDTPSSSHDLSKVATGNYICILEYKDGNTTKKLSQMITIINH